MNVGNKKITMDGIRRKNPKKTGRILNYAEIKKSETQSTKLETILKFKIQISKHFYNFKLKIVNFKSILNDKILKFINLDFPPKADPPRADISNLKFRIKNLSKPYYLKKITVLVVISAVIAMMYFQNTPYSQSAAFTWFQTSWTGGATANTATHTSNQNGWTEYSAKDSNVSAGTEIQLTTASGSVTQTDDGTTNTGFNLFGNIHSQTVLNGSGSAAGVRLDFSPAVDVGTGADGACSWTGGNIDTNVKATYNCTTVSISGVNTVSGASPLVIKATGDVAISGTLSANGGNSPGGAGSAGADGGGAGADGGGAGGAGSTGSNGANGQGTGYGRGGNRGGSGAGFGGSGGNSFSITGGVAYDAGNTGGSGGGGGGNNDSTGGSGGGGGGGSLKISTAGQINISGTVAANGGNGGNNAGNCNTGGGGSGGRITLIAMTTITNNNSIQANGGVAGTHGCVIDFGGGGGGGGRITLQDYDGVITGTGSASVAGGTAAQNYQNGNAGVSAASDLTHYSSGTFTSGAIDTGQNNASWGNLSWTETLNGGSITMKARSADNSTMTGATVWGSCGDISNVGSLTSGSPNCVSSGHRYIQYQATLNSISPYTATPSLDDATIGYNYYPSSRTLTSSIYNSTDSTNVLNKLQWAESLPSGTDVKFQVRTSPDGSSWTSWCGPDDGVASSCTSSTYFTGPTGGETMDDINRDSSNDQYFQYKVFLTSSGANTPTVSDATVTYVVNAVPTVTVTSAVQNSDGTISITYNLSDTDSSTFTVSAYADIGITLNETLDSTDTTITLSSTTLLPTSGTIEIDNEQIAYTGKSGNDLTGCTRGANNTSAVSHTSGSVIWAKATTATGNIGGSQSAGTGKTITWTIKTDYNGVYRTGIQGMVRVSANDGQLANMVGSGNSSTFVIDTKNPTGVSFTINNQTNVLTIATPSDDSSYQMLVSNLSNFSDTSAQTFQSTYTHSSMTSDPATVYLRIKDAYGNYADDSATTPAKPDNVVYYDISNFDTSDWREFVAWGAISALQVGSGFGYYDIQRSTDGNNYSSSYQETDRAKNYYTDTGLNANNTYYYKIQSVDTEGNKSEFSSVVSDQPNGQGSSDQTAPTITDVAVSDIETTSATVTWTTDELADSSVGYSTDQTYLPELGVSSMVTSHSVTLTGLSPNTTYYIRTKSRDVFNNLAQNDYGSPGNNQQSDFVFTTDPGPSISNVATASASNNQATISWTTDINSSTYVVYSDTISGGALVDSSEIGTPNLVGGATPFYHTQTITGLSEGEIYYFYVKSIDASNNTAIDNNGGNFYELRTTSDNDSPIISSISAVIRSDTQAAINWTTDEQANSTVNYGTISGGPYAGSATVSTYDRSHYVILSSLTESATYYYTVTSVDINGNSATSSEYNFSTLEELYTETEAEDLASELADSTTPTIGGVKASDITGESVVVKWDTDEDSSSLVKFGTTTDFGSMAGNDLVNTDIENYVTAHEVIINGLIPNTKYYYTAVSVDASGNIAESGEKNFTTSSPSQISSIKFESKALGQIKVTWKTSKETTSVVEYGLTDSYGERKESSTATKEHEIEIISLNSSVTYHFRVKGKDKDGNLYSSADYTFEPKSPPKISDVKVDSITEHGAKVIFSTNVPTDSLVTYADVTNKDNSGSQGRPELMSRHEVELKNLTSGTTYVLKIKVRDEDGNETEEDFDNFTTSKDENPPAIEQVKTDSALAQNDKVQTIISWNTNEPATTGLLYKEGKNAEEKESEISKNYTDSHIAIVTIFKPGTVYYFKVKSIDQAGNDSVSGEYALLTPKKKENIIQIIINNFQDIFKWAKF